MEMKRSQYRYLVWVLLTLVLATLACNMPGGRDDETAALTPSEEDTLTPRLTSVSEAELTPAFTETPDTGQPTPTLPPGITPSPTVCTYSMSFVTDVTVEDGTEIVAGTTFDKTWRVRNNGCLTWEAGTQLVYVSGNQMGGPAAVDVPNTAVGTTVDITVTLTAPAGAGEHKGYWQLRAPNGIFFGPHIWVRIVVIEPTATPEDTPTPTSTTPPSASHSVTLSAANPYWPSGLRFGQDVTINFSYTTTEPGNVKIFVRPFTGGALTPNYSASGSPNYPTGSGTGSGTFTITSGAAKVDQLRFQMWNADQSQLLHESFVSVNYRFSDHAVFAIGLSPASPAQLTFNQNVTITFQYSTNQPGGVKIFIRPFAGGALAANYGASGSPDYPTGNGSGSGTFTITSGAITVDQLRFQVWTIDQSTLLDEWFITVNYKFQ